MTSYNDNYQTPIEIINGESFELLQPGKGILYARRNQLGLTQQDVANQS